MTRVWLLQFGNTIDMAAVRLSLARWSRAGSDNSRSWTTNPSIAQRHRVIVRATVREGDAQRAFAELDHALHRIADVDSVEALAGVDRM